ncbi:MAG: EutP/PduV family microcompartment system protein [Clostridia bacterium]
MKTMILIGRSGCGKTTLTQALRGETQAYRKTQTVLREGLLIDTPGEYAENRLLGGALALYSYEAHVVGLLLSATEPLSLYGPCITSQANREVVGIVTKIDAPGARPDRAEAWLRLAGCKRIFRVSARTGEGMAQLCAYLDAARDGVPKQQPNPPETGTNKEQTNKTC